MRKILCLSLALGFTASVFAQQQQQPAQQQQQQSAPPQQQQQQFVPVQQQQFVPVPQQQQQQQQQQQFVPVQQQFIPDPQQQQFVPVQQQHFIPDTYQQQQFVPQQQQQVVVPAPQPVAVAEPKSDGREFRFGLYGAISSTPVINNYIDVADLGTMGKIGLLFDLPNKLELGLGLSFARFSRTDAYTIQGVSEEENIAITFVEFTPGISYKLGERHLTSYGIGLDISLGYVSISEDVDGRVSASISTGWQVAFFPNFNLGLEVFKNLNVGLKTGFIVTMLPEDSAVESGVASIKRNDMLIDLKTEIFASFYL
jgi:hypothetical protein